MSIAILSLQLDRLKEDLKLIKAAQGISYATKSFISRYSIEDLEAALEEAEEAIYKEIGRVEKELIKKL